MVITSLAGPSSDSGKAIQVQLSLKALVFGLIEIFGHYLVDKGAGIVDLKGRPRQLPRDDMF